MSYDICFLDIRMPGKSGLDLAAEVAKRFEDDPDSLPHIVFTTAYPDHAVDAFELAAVDYLLKPFSLERLEQAIERVRSRSQAARDPAPRERPPEAAEPTQRLPIERGDRTVFVDESQIVAAAAARGYTYLRLVYERVLVRYTLAELEDRLSSSFYRLHRSYLAEPHSAC